MRMFKVGDVVICIDPKGTYLSSFDTYIVTGINVNDEIIVNNITYNYSYSNFPYNEYRFISYLQYERMQKLKSLLIK